VPDNGTVVNFSGRLSINMTRRTSTDTWMSVHPSRSLFLLVIGGYLSPKKFVCPSTGETEDPLRNKSGAIDGAPAQPGLNRFDFRGYNMLDYGYQMPFGRNAKPRSSMDPRMALAADKGPYFTAGTTDSDGGTPDKKSNTVPPQFGPDAETILKVANERWRPYNSRNHVGEGQNVLFVENHVEL